MGILSLWLSIYQSMKRWVKYLRHNQGALFAMQYESIQKSYQAQLVKAGVYPQKAEQAAKSLSLEEFQLIG